MGTYTVGRILEEALHTMREYSNSGEVADGDAVVDYELSIIPLINKHQISIARETKCYKQVYDIAHNYPENQLDTWEEVEQHIATDISYEGAGSQSYSFQVGGYATIYIEEETGDDVWTTLDTITHTPVAGDGYYTYKGLTNVVDTDNNVRVRFSGDYFYPYRYVGLFAENYPTDAEVPNYQPYVPYTMPDDFMDLDFIDYTPQYGQLINYSDYRIETEGSVETLYINWKDKCEIKVNYFAVPAVIDIPPTTTPKLYNSTTLSIPDKACIALIDMIAADLMRTENAYLSDTLRNHSFITTNSITENQSNDRGARTIQDTYNW